MKPASIQGSQRGMRVHSPTVERTTPQHALQAAGGWIEAAFMEKNKSGRGEVRTREDGKKREGRSSCRVGGVFGTHLPSWWVPKTPPTLQDRIRKGSHFASSTSTWIA